MAFVDGQILTAAELNALPTVQSVQSGSATYAVDTGTANAYVVDFSPAITELVDGMELSFLPSNTNTGPSTLNVNGLGVLPIYPLNSAADFEGSEILIDWPVLVQYLAPANCWILTQSYWINSDPAVYPNNPTILAQFPFVNSGIAGSLTFPNGAILKSGSKTSSGTSSGNAAVTFDEAFPHACLGAVAAIVGTGTGSQTVEVATPASPWTGLSMTTLKSTTKTSGMSIFWWAWGY